MTVKCPDCGLTVTIEKGVRRDPDGWRHYCYPELRRARISGPKEVRRA